MKETCWFEGWFDSPYYHLLYNKRDESEANFFIENLSNYLKLSPDANVWDIACGKGRHALAFAQKGYHVTGTDLSENSIKEALRYKTENADFFVHDMRTLFRTNYFDCALNLFTSLGYFENYSDNFRVFKNVYISLKPNGVFAVDFFNAEKIRSTVISNYTEQRGGITFNITKEIVNKVIYKKITFEDNSESFCFREQVTLLEKEDFEEFAYKAGFSLENVFGDYALNKFEKTTSDRLILIFKK